MISPYKIIGFCSSLALMAGITATSAMAQSIDYIGLSQMYGEPVTTSANGSPQKESDVPLNMEIITAEQIQRTGARSIPEVLRFVPGLNVRQQTFGQYEVGIRGYNQNNSERILVLLNGRQVYADYFGFVAWDNIPVEMSEIKQIEVVKGPNTALFGFNAVSGVINIITVNPLHDELITAEVSRGSQDYSQASGVFSKKISNDVAIKLSGGGYQALDGFDFEPAINDDTTRSSIVLDIWAQLTDNVQAQFELTNSENDRNEFLAASGVTAHSQLHASSARGRVIADTRLGLWELDVYHNELQGDYDLFTGGAELGLEADNRITVGKLHNTFSLGPKHIVRLGAEYRTASNIFAPVDGEDLTYDIYSGTGLWDWRVSNKLRTSAAIRFDSFQLDPDGGDNISSLLPATTSPFTQADFSQRRDEFSYNLGAVYALTPQDTLRASASRGADLPSFLEFGLQFLTRPSAQNPDGVATLGNPDIDTSIVHNFELGYDREMAAINGLFRSAVFYQYNEEMQAFASAIDSTANFFGAGLGVDREFQGNNGDSEMYGVELGLEGQLKDNWDWFLNYAYIHIDDDLRNQRANSAYLSFTEYENAMPQHTINAHIGYEAAQWHAGVFGQYTSRTDGLVSRAFTNNTLDPFEVNDQIMVNAYATLNLTDNISWTISGTSLSGDTQQFVQNSAERSVWTTIKVKY